MNQAQKRPIVRYSSAIQLQQAQAAVASGNLHGAVRLVAALEPVPLGPAEATAAGLVQLIGGDATAALTWFDRALAGAPGFPLALGHRAVALHRLGRLHAAAAGFATAFAAGVTDVEMRFEHAVVLRALGQGDAAIAAFDAVLAQKPDHAGALLAGGETLLEANNPDAALAFFEAAVRADPALLTGWFAIGMLQQSRGALDLALAAFEMVARLRPGNADALSNCGAILLHLGRPTEALAACDAALAIRQNFVEAHANRGCALMRLLRFDDALATFEAALAAKPTHLESLSNHALVLQELGRLDAADAAFVHARNIHPESATIDKNHAMLQLLRGDFVRGLPAYEARWAAGQNPIFPEETAVPVWPGPAAGFGRLLVVDEQGFGDALMFVRFLPLLAARGARVTFLCRPNLCALLASAMPEIQITGAMAESSFDHRIGLASLPLALGITSDTIPAERSYLSADPARVAAWAARTGGEGLRVGLCWQGNASNIAYLARSIPLAAFAPLAAVPGVRLISLQQRDGLDQIDDLADRSWLECLPDVDPGPDAFLDTAALMASLDLVITCDTAIAHLAGALGRPVWTLLKTNPDWRWQLDRADSPWYPTMRLFRQTRAGDWDGVMADVAAALRALT